MPIETKWDRDPRELGTVQTPGEITIESLTAERDVYYKGRSATGAASCSRPLGINVAAMKGEHRLTDDPSASKPPCCLTQHQALCSCVTAKITDITESQTNAGSFPWKWCIVEIQIEGMDACVQNTWQQKWHYNFQWWECSSKLLKVGSESGLLWEESQLETALQSRQQSSITIPLAFEGHESLTLVRNPRLKKANILLPIESF